MEHNYAQFNYVSVGNKIYGIPGTGEDIVCINTVNKTQQQIGYFTDYEMFGSFKWSKGILAPNGKIYAAPYDANAILCINPSDDSYSFIGDFSGVDYNDKCFFDSFLAPNGKIYYMGVSRCLCLDPSTETYVVYRDLNTNGGHKKHILAPNGKIYGIPYEAEAILCMDTNTDIINSISINIPFTPDGSGFRDAFIVNNNLYMIGNCVLSLNMLDNTYTTFAHSIYGNDYIQYIFINNKIYGIPNTMRGCHSILCVDVINQTYKMFGDLEVVDDYGDLEWVHCVIGSDNRIYGIPLYSSRSVMCIDPGTDSIVLFKDALYGGVFGTLADNDDIYILPMHDTKKIIKLSQSEYTEPSVEPPSTLSAYVKVDNVYQPIISMYVKTDGIYKQLSSMFAKINNGWINLL
jgi:outer membrane protein assembly factor BamB